jgi:hypothetical protein
LVLAAKPLSISSEPIAAWSQMMNVASGGETHPRLRERKPLLFAPSRLCVKPLFFQASTIARRRARDYARGETRAGGSGRRGLGL